LVSATEEAEEAEDGAAFGLTKTFAVAFLSFL